MYVNNFKFNKHRGHKNRTTVQKLVVRAAIAESYDEETERSTAYWYIRELNKPHIAGKSSRYQWNNYETRRNITITLPAGDLRTVANCAEIILGKKVLGLLNTDLGKSFSGKTRKVTGVALDVMQHTETKSTCVLETAWELPLKGDLVKSTTLKCGGYWKTKERKGTHFSQFITYGNRKAPVFSKKPRQKSWKDLPYAKFTRNWYKW